MNPSSSSSSLLVFSFTLLLLLLLELLVPYVQANEVVVSCGFELINAASTTAQTEYKLNVSYSSSTSHCNFTFFNSSFTRISLLSANDNLTLRHLHISVRNCTIISDGFAITSFSFASAITNNTSGLNNADTSNNWPALTPQQDQEADEHSPNILKTLLPQAHIEFIDCTFKNSRLEITDLDSSLPPPYVGASPRLIHAVIDGCSFADDVPGLSTEPPPYSIELHHLQFIQSIRIANCHLNLAYACGIRVTTVVNKFVDFLQIENNTISTKSTAIDRVPIEVGYFNERAFPRLDISIVDNTISVTFARSMIYIRGQHSANRVIVSNNTIKLNILQQYTIGAYNVLFVRDFVGAVPNGVFIEHNNIVCNLKHGGLIGVRNVRGDGMENRKSQERHLERNSVLVIRNNNLTMDHDWENGLDAMGVSIGGLDPTPDVDSVTDFRQILVEHNMISVATTRRVSVMIPDNSMVKSLQRLVRCFGVHLISIQYISEILIRNNNISLEIKKDFDSDALTGLIGIGTEMLVTIDSIHTLSVSDNVVKARGTALMISGLAQGSRVDNQSFSQIHLHSNTMDFSESRLIEYARIKTLGFYALGMPSTTSTPNMNCFLVDADTEFLSVNNNICILREPRFELYHPYIRFFIIGYFADNAAARMAEFRSNFFRVLPLGSDQERTNRYIYYTGTTESINPDVEASTTILYQSATCLFISYGPSRKPLLSSYSSLFEDLIVSDNQMQVSGASFSSVALLLTGLTEFSSAGESMAKTGKEGILVHDNYLSVVSIVVSAAAAAGMTSSRILLHDTFTVKRTVGISEPVGNFVSAKTPVVSLVRIRELYHHNEIEGGASSSSNVFGIQLQNNRMCITSELSPQTQQQQQQSDGGDETLLTASPRCSLINITSIDTTRFSLGRNVEITNNVGENLSACREFSVAIFQVTSAYTSSQRDLTLVLHQNHFANLMLPNPSPPTNGDENRVSFVDFVSVNGGFRPESVNLIIQENSMSSSLSSSSSSFSSGAAAMYFYPGDFELPNSIDRYEQSPFVKLLNISSSSICNSIFGQRVTKRMFFFASSSSSLIDDTGCSSNNDHQHDRSQSLTVNKTNSTANSNHSSTTPSPFSINTNNLQLETITAATQSVNMIAATAAAAAISPSLGFGVARQQGVINFIQDLRDGSCGRVKAVEGVPFADSPTQLSIGESNARFYVGGVVGNFTLSLGLILLMQIVGTILMRNDRRRQSKALMTQFEVFGRCHVSLVTFVCVSILLGPTLTFALVSLTQTEIPIGEKVLVAIFGLVLFALPSFYFAIWALLLRRSSTAHDAYRISSSTKQEGNYQLQNHASSLWIKRILNYWFAGKGEWKFVTDNRTSSNKNEKETSTNNDELFLFEVALPVFDGYSGGAGDGKNKNKNKSSKYFALAEFSSMLGLALAKFIAMLVPENDSCVTAFSILAITLGSFLLLCLYFRPFQELFHRIAFPVIGSIEIVVLAVAFFMSGKASADETNTIITLATVMSVLKNVVTVIDILASLPPLYEMIKKSCFPDSDDNKLEEHHHHRRRGHDSSQRRRSSSYHHHRHHYPQLEDLLVEGVEDDDMMLNSQEMLANLSPKKNTTRRRGTDQQQSHDNDKTERRRSSDRRRDNSSPHSCYSPKNSEKDDVLLIRQGDSSSSRRHRHTPQRTSSKNKSNDTSRRRATDEPRSNNPERQKSSPVSSSSTSHRHARNPPTTSSNHVHRHHDCVEDKNQKYSQRCRPSSSSSSLASPNYNNTQHHHRHNRDRNPTETSNRSTTSSKTRPERQDRTSATRTGTSRSRDEKHKSSSSPSRSRTHLY